MSIWEYKNDKTMLSNIYKIIAILILCCINILAFGQDCECTNCPVPIYNNQVSYAHLNVNVDGENDLSECTLEQVCFQISHTWVGDLSASLTSPNGTRYLVMADINNDTLGCGTKFNNINVCVNVGTDNPLTNNTEYECNGPEWDCLIGEDWTVPCGGVFDPRTGAIQTPNCDLNDFNVPGSPANGVWTLAVSDICPWDVGFIETFSLGFSCEASCFSCEAEGGTLLDNDIVACEGSPDLVISPSPDPEAPSIDSDSYGYTYLISVNDTILAHSVSPDLSTFSSGTYNICGLSYHVDEADQLDSLIGRVISNIMTTPPFCMDVANNCNSVYIHPQGVAQTVEIQKCFEDCAYFEGLEYCVEGNYEILLVGSYGCDSIINLMVIDINNSNPTTRTEYICEGDCIELYNNEYCEEGTYELTFTSSVGCDSIIELTVISYQNQASSIVQRTVCYGDCIQYEGTDYCDEGEYAVVLTNYQGCDSLITLQLSYFLENVATDLNIEICQDDCYNFNNQDYCNEGDYKIILNDENGCESIIYLHLSYLVQNEVTDQEVWLCVGDCYSVNGNDYCDTGTFQIIHDDENGCDSLVNLSINHYETENPTDVILIRCLDECVLYNGTEYCQNGQYTINDTNENNCEIVINLTIRSVSPDIIFSGRTEITCTNTEAEVIAFDTQAESYQWVDENGLTISTNDTLHTSVVGCYTVIVTYETNNEYCESQQEICITEDIIPVPQISINNTDTLICLDSKYEYSTTIVGNVIGYEWTIYGNGIVTSPFDTDFFIVQWQDTNGGTVCVRAYNECGYSEEDCHTIQGNILAIDEPVNLHCDLETEQYTIQFSIQPTSVLPEIVGITGNWTEFSFQSDPINGNLPYHFTLEDQACGDLLFNGASNCYCSTEAGEIQIDNSNLCFNSNINIENIGSTNIADDEVLYFVIHDGSIDQLGNIIAYNTTGQFEITNTIFQANQTYIVHAVAGQVDGDFILMEDPCLDYSNGLPFIVSDFAISSISNPDVICIGQTADITLNLQGEGPFSFTLNGTEYTNVETPYTINIEPTQDTFLIFDNITNVYGCNDDTTIQATIEVHQPEEFELQNTASVCNTLAPNDDFTINLEDLILEGNTTGTWTDDDHSQASGTLPNLDFRFVEPGDYNFTFTPTQDNNICESESYTVTITVENCTCSAPTLLTGMACVEDGFLFDLDQLIEEYEYEGTWSLFEDYQGVSIEQNSIHIGQTNLQSIIAVFTQTENLVPGCPSTWNTSINLITPPNSGQNIGTYSLCQGENETINLFDLIDDYDIGGTWSTNNNTIGQSFDTNNNTLNTENLSSGTYHFNYTIPVQTPCTIIPSTTVTIQIYDLPEANAGPDVSITCSEESILLGQEGTQGYTYIWQVADVILGQNPTYSASVEGTYWVSVTDQNGCTSIDTVIVQDLSEAPSTELLVTPISCYDTEDGNIQVVNTTGGQSPYQYSINGSEFSNQTEFSFLGPDNYVITVMDANGCSSTIQFNLEQPQESFVELQASIIQEDEIIIVLGDSIIFEAITNIDEENITNIQWFPNEYLNCDTCLTVVATPIETTTFTVYLENNFCEEVEASITVRVNKGYNINLPDAFSPNGDGNNDYFFPFGDSKIKNIDNFMIFSRWGEEVFKRTNFPPNDPTHGWDGTYRAKILNNGVFVWVAEVTFLDGTKLVFKGDVTIIK